MSGIDWDRLNELRTDIGEEDFADVATLFVAELHETLDRLTPEAAVAADFHFLRGSAANLGFVALVAACSEAEVACNAGAMPDIAAVHDAFHAALDEITPEFPDLASAA